MPNIYFFRGKAATGKTTLSNILSNKINIVVLRKDDIFDSLSQFIEDISYNNHITYNVLSKLIQTNIDNKVDVIVDVGLSNTDGWKTFKTKFDFKDYKIYTFLCDCTDLDVWKSRFDERLKNPTPNQHFKSVEEVISYYEKSKIELLDGEYYIDSSESLNTILQYVLKTIDR